MVYIMEEQILNGLYHGRANSWSLDQGRANSKWFLSCKSKFLESWSRLSGRWSPIDQPLFESTSSVRCLCIVRMLHYIILSQYYITLSHHITLHWCVYIVPVSKHYKHYIFPTLHYIVQSVYIVPILYYITLSKCYATRSQRNILYYIVPINSVTYSQPDITLHYIVQSLSIFPMSHYITLSKCHVTKSQHFNLYYIEAFTLSHLLALHIPNMILHYITLCEAFIFSLCYITLHFNLCYIEALTLSSPNASNAQASAPMSLPIQCHSRLTRPQIENAKDFVPQHTISDLLCMQYIIYDLHCSLIDIFKLLDSVETQFWW